MVKFTTVHQERLRLARNARRAERQALALGVAGGARSRYAASCRARLPQQRPQGATAPCLWVDGQAYPLNVDELRKAAHWPLDSRGCTARDATGRMPSAPPPRVLFTGGAPQCAGGPGCHADHALDSPGAARYARKGRIVLCRCGAIYPVLWR